MKTLSILFYLIATVLTIAGLANMFVHFHQFGGITESGTNAYTYIVSLGYAQCYFLLGLIFFFLGFASGYHSLKHTEIIKEEIKEGVQEDTNTYDYIDGAGNIRNVTPKTARMAGWSLKPK